MTGTDGTLLVVDDDPDFRSLYEHWLSPEYDVRTAADGVTALEQIDATIDVVVLDREMPEKDGIAVARELRTRSVDPGVVMVSGVEPDTDLLDVPVDDYIQKPVKSESVSAAVRRAKAVAESRDRLRRLLALDTRIDIVESNVDAGTLADSEAYQRATGDLEARMAALSGARPTVFPTSDGEPDSSPERNSVRNSL